MSRPWLPLLLCLGLAACSAPAPDEQEQAVVQAEQRAAEDAQPAPQTEVATDATTCDATQAQWTVGKVVGEADVEQARKDAGATRVRTLKPGQPTTMEYDAARLNLDVDDKGAVTAARCG